MFKNKSFTFLLVLMLTFVLPITAFADNDKTNSAGPKAFEYEYKYEYNYGDLENKEEFDKGQNKEWIKLKNSLEQEKDEIEALKDTLEEQKDALEEECEAAEESGDLETAASLKNQIEDMKQQINEYKLQMHNKIQNMHEVMKGQYTQEEWDALNETVETLTEEDDLTVLPVENVFFKGGNIKFDTPPIIKQNRALISIRSVSEAVGANVEWNKEKNMAKIHKGTIIIEFDFANTVVYVNGSETELDVPAEIINNRIVVPLRFIVENMNLQIDWDQDTNTIEISEPGTSESDESTTTESTEPTTTESGE